MPFWLLFVRLWTSLERGNFTNTFKRFSEGFRAHRFLAWQYFCKKIRMRQPFCPNFWHHSWKKIKIWSVAQRNKTKLSTYTKRSPLFFYIQIYTLKTETYIIFYQEYFCIFFCTYSWERHSICINHIHNSGQISPKFTLVIQSKQLCLFFFNTTSLIFAE